LNTEVIAMRKKWWIIIGVVVGLLALAGVAGGLVYAQTNNAQHGSQPATTPGKSLADRVAAILGIDQTKVENAFTQAQKDTQDEALTNWLNSQVTQGKMTQAQADQYKTWWQSRPTTPQGIGPFGRGFPGFQRMPRMGGLPATPSTSPSTN
jgi:hypothetical protein